jgi:hypothetical protein
LFASIGKIFLVSSPIVDFERDGEDEDEKEEEEEVD